jgi:cytochrome b561
MIIYQSWFLDFVRITNWYIITIWLIFEERGYIYIYKKTTLRTINLFGAISSHRPTLVLLNTDNYILEIFSKIHKSFYWLFLIFLLGHIFSVKKNSISKQEIQNIHQKCKWLVLFPLVFFML